MANKNLSAAKRAKNDEFYTQYADIQKEVNAYLDYNPDVFRDKVILLPCDDPEWSNFTKFFAQNFERFGIKKLISTSYACAAKGKDACADYCPTLFEYNSEKFNKDKTETHGKIFTLTRDTNHNGRIDIDDLEWQYLDGDGDFRSDEIKKLRDAADIIVTNPPFSLFRQFLAWVIDSKKQFLIIGNKNCITYKEVFPLIKSNQLWVGTMPMGFDILFDVPDNVAKELIKKYKEGSKYRIINNKVKARASGIWFTNIEHGKRHKHITLMTMDDNIKFSKHKEIRNIGYQKYDNYDAIEVPYSDAIPSDYDGVMGVPISFLDKYCPEQFEIIKFRKGDDDKDLSIDGKYPYFRILIKGNA
ncbi:MAG: adenine-specific methyltransferase EcoRI family protein [Pseudomonadota bacterium]|nr:adenine-specific methyltransferase EcoRI family protein [Pseudomonadota bacterium]